MDHGCRCHHTAAMGPYPQQQSTQQSTNIICDGSTSLKLETKVFITSNITINARLIDVDEWWLWCSNATMGAVQPAQWYRLFWWNVTAPNNIFDEGWRRGGGLRTSNFSATKGVNGGIGFFYGEDSNGRLLLLAAKAMVRRNLECVLKVIYCSTYLGIVFRSLMFETSIFNPRTSKFIVITTSTMLHQLIFCYEDSVRDCPEPFAGVGYS